MRLNKKYKIENIICKEQYRNISNAYYDTKKEHLVATDGKMMAIVPVEADCKDVSGPISKAALQEARRMGKNYRSTEELTIVAKKKLIIQSPYKPERTIVMPRSENNDHTFPDYVPVIPNSNYYNTFQICLNPKLLLELARAIGVKDNYPVCLTFDTSNDRNPVVVKDGDNDMPLGILMPCRK